MILMDYLGVAAAVLLVLIARRPPGNGRRVREVVDTLGAPSRHAEPTYLLLSVELPPPPPLPLPLDPE